MKTGTKIIIVIWLAVALRLLGKHINKNKNKNEVKG
tara:strand:+ start:2451 stop:2558 length:108 start_codon:yes stop_codon:yes gene_type:complete